MEDEERFIFRGKEGSERMIHVYLDDYRPCPKGFVPARSAEECILLLQECDVDILSLDFDLGWHAPNGTAVAEWVARTGKYPKRIYLHTSSPAGRQHMYQLLYAQLPEGAYLHNGPMPDGVLGEATAASGAPSGEEERK